MKKIIELSSLVVLMFAIVVTDVNIYRKACDEASNKYVVAQKKYEAKKDDVDSITLVSFNDYIVNQVNVKEEIKQQEYLAYLQSLIVYDGLTMDELVEKLDRSLKNELSGYGRLYAEYSLEKGVDPYIAVAISLHETGCNGHCSSLMTSCNNVGGQKGSPTCGAGSYRQFDSLEDGIKGYIDNLSNNYFGIGLNTPELMASKYAASTTWASKVNYYIDTIKSR